MLLLLSLLAIYMASGTAAFSSPEASGAILGSPKCLGGRCVLVLGEETGDLRLDQVVAYSKLPYNFTVQTKIIVRCSTH